GGDLADPVVAGVGDVQVPRHVQRDLVGAVQQRGAGRAAVAGVAGGAGGAARDGVDVPGGHGLAPLGAGAGGDRPDRLVVGVGDVQVAGGVQGDRGRRDQQRGGGRAAVAAVAAGAIGAPGHGVDVPGGHGDAELGVAGGGDLLHPVVGGVGDEDVAMAVGGHA